MSADPQAPFWHAIERDPAAPEPRLVFADWCDENGLPAMAEVQRWLAATGRYPCRMYGRKKDRNETQEILAAALYFDLGFGWRRVFSPARDGALWGVPNALPAGLFRCLPSGTYYLNDYGRPRDEAYYPTPRRAQEALAVAWLRATRPSRRWEFWRQTWVPDWTPPKSSEAVPPRAGSDSEV